MTQENPQAAAIQREIEQMRADIAELRARLDRWEANGLAKLNASQAFAGSGGLYGATDLFARADHTH